jgi:hypothetical protein
LDKGESLFSSNGHTTMHHMYTHFCTQIERKTPTNCSVIFVISSSDREFSFLWTAHAVVARDCLHVRLKVFKGVFCCQNMISNISFSHEIEMKFLFPKPFCISGRPQWYQFPIKFGVSNIEYLRLNCFNIHSGIKMDGDDVFWMLW